MLRESFVIWRDTPETYILNSCRYASAVEVLRYYGQYKQGFAEQGEIVTLICNITFQMLHLRIESLLTVISYILLATFRSMIS